MRKVLLATVSAMTLSLGTAWADEALVIEDEGVAESTIDASASDTTEIDNPFGYGNYDAEEILHADLISLDGQQLVDPIDLLIDSDENVALIVTYVSGQLIAIETAALKVSSNDPLVLHTDYTHEELVAMGHFDISKFDYRLYSEDVYNMTGLSEADAETSGD